eukprot:CAMPEP_0172738512 /NCGR_PEP_ID=MMETSP1074-20121228/120359_1 /TAXON_ID=2916 /ORGANISM="Ceratium fusus, Strain PA161109" /LENGTH=555 /DNA_ID=CAMNT_0013568159 /DNA_START=135 /DNA_END=1802 /DNA_ORIENTATION=-
MVTCADAGTVKLFGSSDSGAREDTVGQQLPNHRTARLRKKANSAARKDISPCVAHGNALVSRSINIERSKAATAAGSVYSHRLAENEPASGTSMVRQLLPSAVLAELVAGSGQEYDNMHVYDGSAVMRECMAASLDDAETEDEAEAATEFATKMQEADDNQREQLRGCRANAEGGVSQQPGLNLKEESQNMGDDMEVSHHLMEHEISRVGQHMEEEEEEEEAKETKQSKDPEEKDESQVGVNMEVAPGNDEQCHLRGPKLEEWPDMSEDGSMDEDYQDWARPDDDMMHQSCLHALNRSEPQYGTREHDTLWKFSTNDHIPNFKSIDSCSGDQNQHGQLDNDPWTTPFVPVNGESPGMLKDHACLGTGQCGSHRPQSAVGGGAWAMHSPDIADGWLTQAKWKSSWPGNDCWMTPFDELIQKTEPHDFAASDTGTAPPLTSPFGPAVCIWKAGKHTACEANDDTSQEKDGPEVFTDGQRVFQPVPSVTGRPLFTDGMQLFASVCVVFGPPGPPSESAKSVLDMTCNTCKSAPAFARLSLPPGSIASFTADWSDIEEP